MQKGDISNSFLANLNYFLDLKKETKSKIPFIKLNYLITSQGRLFLEETLNFFADNFTRYDFESFTYEHIVFSQDQREKLNLNRINIP